MSSDETQKLLVQWAESFNRNIEELKTSMAEAILKLQSAAPGKTAVFYEQRAKWQVYHSLKRRRSNAEDYEILILAVGEDRNARRYGEALAMYAENPAKAVSDGYTNAKGIPLDNTPEWGDGRRNPFYKRPLRPLRTLAALASPLGPEGKVDLALRMFANILVSGDAANFNFVVGKTYVAKLNMAQDQGSPKIRYDLNSATVTEFKECPNPTPILDARGLCDVLSSAPRELSPELINLLEYHTENSNDSRRLVILEGDLMFINRTPNSNGSYMCLLEDESLGMTSDVRGITLFVPAEQYDSQLKTVGQGSHVYAIGRTSTGAGWNTETRTFDEEIKAVIVNVIAIIADPEMIISPDEEKISQADDEARE